MHTALSLFHEENKKEDAGETRIEKIAGLSEQILDIY
jgi:hypothetical protein